METDRSAARVAMVQQQLEARGIKDARVLAAMRELPRERFVREDVAAAAYEDRPLPIGHGQTISQPYIVARMLELARVRPDDKGLEVGAGSGYALALLARLCRQAYGLEIIPELARRAQANLAAAGVANATMECRDGALGDPDHQPFDVILVSAGAPRVPALLLTQLAEGGRMVIPVGERDQQRLVLIERHGDEFTTSWATAVRFVDLTGRHGFGAGGGPQA